jgi:hybrid cluster-associated redox disulfide protein
MNDKKKFITKDMLILEVIQKYPETLDIFMDHGIGCIGCRAAEYETLEQGISLHGIDVDKFVELLNEKMEAENKKTG